MLASQNGVKIITANIIVTKKGRVYDTTFLYKDKKLHYQIPMIPLQFKKLTANNMSQNHSNILFCAHVAHFISGLVGGHYWGVNPESINYPTVVECFASPFNHTSPRYFSLYDGDRIFGAIGNFFKTPKKNITQEDILFISPPFTEAIIKRTLNMNLDFAGAVVFHLPYWEDLLSKYKKLHTKHFIITNKVYDHLKHKMTVNNFKVAIYCISKDDRFRDQFKKIITNN